MAARRPSRGAEAARSIQLADRPRWRQPSWCRASIARATVHASLDRGPDSDIGQIAISHSSHRTAARLSFAGCARGPLIMRAERPRAVRRSLGHNRLVAHKVVPIDRQVLHAKLGDVLIWDIVLTGWDDPEHLSDMEPPAWLAAIPCRR